jgi:hypothetical protein
MRNLAQKETGNEVEIPFVAFVPFCQKSSFHESQSIRLHVRLFANRIAKFHLIHS